MTTTTRPVTLAAVVKRINRRLAHKNEQLRKTRGWNHNLGDWYVDTYESGCRPFVDPETLAREIGVLADDEEVVG